MMPSAKTAHHGAQRVPQTPERRGCKALETQQRARRVADEADGGDHHAGGRRNAPGEGEGEEHHAPVGDALQASGLRVDRAGSDRGTEKTLPVEDGKDYDDNQSEAHHPQRLRNDGRASDGDRFFARRRPEEPWRPCPR